jgi:hypothetical protein
MTVPRVSAFEGYSSTARSLVRFASVFGNFSQDSDPRFALAAQKPTSILEERWQSS